MTMGWGFGASDSVTITFSGWELGASDLVTITFSGWGFGVSGSVTITFSGEVSVEVIECLFGIGVILKGFRSRILIRNYVLMSYCYELEDIIKVC